MKLRATLLSFFSFLLFSCFNPSVSEAVTLNYQQRAYPWDAEKIANCGEYVSGPSTIDGTLWALNKEHEGVRGLYINKKSGNDGYWTFVRNVPASIKQITCTASYLWLWDTATTTILYTSEALGGSLYPTGEIVTLANSKDFTIGYQSNAWGYHDYFLYVVDNNGQVRIKQMFSAGSNYNTVDHLDSYDVISALGTDLYKYNILSGVTSLKRHLGTGHWEVRRDMINPAFFLYDFKVGLNFVTATSLHFYALDYASHLFKSDALDITIEVIDL